ncbi:DUF1127 domain-containing protein [Halotalea alkalilenta]|uniref:DUF1127 domain-containing protein n=1 Tax=Halotalea alkalilenta TaxID=376489 RepID=UPI00069476A3|nr:DUF1127 domain-containing protein [Halotalea alkalilenta]
MNAPLHSPNLPSTPRARLIALLKRWLRRSTTRAQLAALSPEQLRDIGITHGEALREARLPFWLAGEMQQTPEWWECPPVKRGGLSELESRR